MHGESSLDFYKFLRKQGLNPRNLEKKINSWKNSEILDFAKEAHIRLLHTPAPQNSVFTFSANSTLSGNPTTCYHSRCRLQNLDSLARFAVLYADKVYINNPFERYANLHEVNDFTRPILAGDIAGMLHLKPLVTNGIISIQNNYIHLCQDCLEQIEAIEEELEKQTKNIRKVLNKEFHKKITATLRSMDDEIFISMEGPEDLIDHERIDLVGEIPETLLDGYTLGEKRVLLKKEIKENYLFDVIINQMTTDLFQQSLRAKWYQTQYLTNKEIELKVGTINVGERSQLSKAMIEGLEHLVPTIHNIKLSKILDLRVKEGEAFEVYRDKLRSALKQAKKLNADEMKELIQDEIDPEISQNRSNDKKGKKVTIKIIYG